MIKFLFIFLSLFSYVLSIEILNPTYTLKTNGEVQDILYKNNLLYAGNSNGSVEIFDTNSKELVKSIKLPNIVDYIGELAPSKIFSIDVMKNKILIVSQGKGSYRELWIYDNTKEKESEKLIKIFSTDKKYIIQKASFIDENLVFFALLSNEIGLYNLKEKKNEYFEQISHSSFSHYRLNENRDSVVITDESGIVRLFDTKTGKMVKEIGALNLDRVFQLDYKNGSVLTSGQDRKAIFYPSIGTPSKLAFDFLLYSCALSPSAKYGAISYNENNDILVFNTITQSYLYSLVGQNSTITQILFVGDDGVFASSDSDVIAFWKLK